MLSEGEEKNILNRQKKVLVFCLKKLELLGGCKKAKKKKGAKKWLKMKPFYQRNVQCRFSSTIFEYEKLNSTTHNLAFLILTILFW